MNIQLLAGEVIIETTMVRIPIKTNLFGFFCPILLDTPKI